MSAPKSGKTFEGPGATGHLTTSRDGELLYVANDNAGTINAISVKSKIMMSSVTIGGTIHGIDVSPDGETIYAADYEVFWSGTLQ